MTCRTYRRMARGWGFSFFLGWTWGEGRAELETAFGHDSRAGEKGSQQVGHSAFPFATPQPRQKGSGHPTTVRSDITGTSLEGARLEAPSPANSNLCQWSLPGSQALPPASGCIQLMRKLGEINSKTQD